MLRINVGMSRKVTEDFQSTGFSVNLDGEIATHLDNPETAVERMHEFFDLCEAALNDRIERHQEKPSTSYTTNKTQSIPNTNGSTDEFNYGANYQSNNNPTNQNTNGRSRPANDPPATNKQIQYLLNLSKQRGISSYQLKNRIAGIIGKECDVYDLSKKQAGTVLDDLTADNGNGKQRSNAH